MIFGGKLFFFFENIFEGGNAIILWVTAVFNIAKLLNWWNWWNVEYTIHTQSLHVKQIIFLQEIEIENKREKSLECLTTFQVNYLWYFANNMITIPGEPKIDTICPYFYSKVNIVNLTKSRSSSFSNVLFRKKCIILTSHGDQWKLHLMCSALA